MEDTDSMAIVATRRGGLISCPGGSYVRTNDAAIKALSWKQVEDITTRFAALNPYDRSAIPGSILKIETDNFDPKTRKQRQLYCLAISAKRYALFLKDRRGNPELLRKDVNNDADRWSEHGLGHLLNPTDPESDDRKWVGQAWLNMVRKSLEMPAQNLEFEDRPAVGRVTVSSPAVIRPLAKLNDGKAYPNHQNLYAVIVADECLDATAFQLAKILHGVESRVRLITIDNALEGADRSELRLSRISTSEVEKIAEANFPDIDQSRRYRYCQLAEGYLRFAIFLCDNDALIVQQGHLGQLLSDTKSYLGTLFGSNGPFAEADFEALKVISLVERCGVVDNVYPELEQLCALVGLNPTDVRGRLHRMQKANGRHTVCGASENSSGTNSYWRLSDEDSVRDGTPDCFG